MLRHIASILNIANAAQDRNYHIQNATCKGNSLTNAKDVSGKQIGKAVILGGFQLSAIARTPAKAVAWRTARRIALAAISAA